MQNNRIYVDGRLIDATQLTDGQWEYLVAANRDSTKRRLVKCAWCWQEDHATHWMKTYSKADGTRIVSHQAGESGDHPYQALESDEHRATCDRVERVWTAEGGTAVREALAAATADKYLVLNLDGKHLSADGILESTQDFSSASYLWIWKNNFPEVELDYVLADPAYVDDVEHLRRACESVGAELVLDRIVTTNPIQNWSKSAESPRHSAHLLAAALGTLLSRGTI